LISGGSNKFGIIRGSPEFKVLMPKKESIRYLENAKEILGKSPVEEDRYSDLKYVQEVCGTAYLAVLKAVDEYLLKRGISKKDLPQSVDDYRAMLRKHPTVRNGKLLKDFEALYKELHISGYCRGNLEHVEIVRAALKIARSFMNKIEQ
jgi:hypothetical protein